MKNRTVIVPRRQTHEIHPLIKIFLSSLKAFIIVILAISLCLGGLLAGAVYAYIQTAEPVNEEHLLNVETSGLTTYIYDEAGNITAMLTGKDNKNREVIDYKQIPKHLEHALVAIEDERFYKHNGIDIPRTVSAALIYVTGIGSRHGGSTITQQLVKHLTDRWEGTPQRKIQEQWNALQLEKRLEKWQIITMYLNVIYMGNGCYGVQSAAKTYFGKDVSELNLAECALLAGITNEPGTYNPFTKEGRIAAEKRKNIILAKMLELGYISESEYKTALYQRLQYADPQERVTSVAVNSYFVDQVINDVINDLAEKYNIPADLAEMRLYNNGLQIYTTQDPVIQEKMDEVFNNPEFFWQDNDIAARYGEKPQAAMVIIDPYTGYIKAMYGGSGKKEADRTFNRATQLKRQTGSSFKPIAIYGPAIDLKLITPATIVDDVPVRMHTPYDNADINELYPLNFDRNYTGLISVRDALKRSINVVAAKLWRDTLGADSSVEYLARAGINRENEKYVSMALGGLNEGVSPMEMAGAYIPFVNNGVYIKPVTYTKVLDANGNTILEKKPEYSVVYSEETAFLMTDMMQEVTRTGGTAAGIVSPEYTGVDGNKIPTAGKTGTTSNNIDKWFVGFTPYYIGAVWYGYDNKIEPIPLQYGEERNKALRIWQAVMQSVHEDLDGRNFPDPPKSIVQRDICIYSGKIATELCRQDPRGSAVRTEYFIKGTEPFYLDTCDVHVKVKVCKQSQDIWGRDLLAGPNCPERTIEEKVLIMRPEPYVPEMPNDPYPLDWKYEIPIAEYCTVHGAANGQNTP